MSNAITMRKIRQDRMFKIAYYMFAFGSVLSGLFFCLAAFAILSTGPWEGINQMMFGAGLAFIGAGAILLFKERSYDDYFDHVAQVHDLFVGRLAGLMLGICGLMLALRGFFIYMQWGVLFT